MCGLESERGKLKLIIDVPLSYNYCHKYQSLYNFLTSMLHNTVQNLQSATLKIWYTPDWLLMFLLQLTLSVPSDVYAHQCTIRANVHIRPGTAGSSEITIQGWIVSAAENNKNGWFGTMYSGDARTDYRVECYLDRTG